MSFAPLHYVWSTLTMWHAVVLVLLVTGSLIVGSAPDGSVAGWSGQALKTGSIFGLLYVVAIIVLGQVFGDKFALSQIWPTSVALGVLFAATFLTWVKFSTKDDPPLFFLFIAFLFFAPLLSGFFTLVFYLLPRTVGGGIVAIPKLSWGVHL